MDDRIGLSRLQVESLFPFFVETDPAGRVIDAGPSMKKMLQSKMAGFPFAEFFEFERPAKATFEELEALKGKMIVLKERRFGAKFMGQVMSIESSIVFFINMVVQDASNLSEAGLTFADFAVQDQVLDFLILVQTQRRSIKEADQLNQKLAAAHKTAVEASEMKSKFLANMSHELRTPMNGVIGLASVLMETGLDAEQLEILGNIMKSGENMLSLVNDILDISKIEAGHMTLDEEPVDIHEIANEVLHTMRVTAEKKRIELTLENSLTCPSRVMGDPARLRQVLLNLVSNAVKFTDEGGVHVQIESPLVDGDERTFKFIVTDSGIGMSKETLALIFKPFVQGDDSMSKKHAGTGLGLSICKNLVTAMGGEIGVKSIIGNGSQFWFTVKLRNAQPPGEGRSSATQSS